MDDDIDIDEENIEWRVLWFPPNGDRTRTGTEAEVRRIADRNREWNPIIERRQVIVTHWENVNDS